MKTFYIPYGKTHYEVRAYDDFEAILWADASHKIPFDVDICLRDEPKDSECLGKFVVPIIIAIDIETDGLEHKGGQILEVCMHRLDGQLNIVDTFEGVLPFNIENFSEFIMDMHTKNGLIGTPFTIMAADVVYWLSQYENIVWLGSSVHFDAAWMREHFPEADVNHRVIDVSSLKGLVDLTDRLPKTESDHRAASDIAYSLDVARLYRDVLLAS